MTSPSGRGRRADVKGKSMVFRLTEMFRDRVWNLVALHRLAGDDFSAVHVIERAIDEYDLNYGPQLRAKVMANLSDEIGKGEAP